VPVDLQNNVCFVSFLPLQLHIPVLKDSVFY
jgi:hypothetical protein